MKKTIKSEDLMRVLKAVVGSATVSHDMGEYGAEEVCKKIMTELAYLLDLKDDEMRKVLAEGFKLAEQAQAMLDMRESATIQ